MRHKIGGYYIVGVGIGEKMFNITKGTKILAPGQYWHKVNNRRGFFAFDGLVTRLKDLRSGKGMHGKIYIIIQAKKKRENLIIRGLGCKNCTLRKRGRKLLLNPNEVGANNFLPPAKNIQNFSFHAFFFEFLDLCSRVPGRNEITTQVFLTTFIMTSFYFHNNCVRILF